MAGYEIQVKSSSGEMLSLPIIAQYDGDGNDIALTYATKAELEKAGLIAITTTLNENIPTEMLTGVVANPQNYVVVSSSASNTPGFYVGRSGNTLMYRNNNIAFSGGQTIGIGFNIDTTTGLLTNTIFTLVSKAGEGYGTVNPTSKTEEMTQPVGVDANGALWAESSGESFNSSGIYPNLTAGEATHAQSADTANSAASATDAVNAQLAVKATQDAAGNNIQSTYATKTELSAVISGTTPVAKATAADSATNATYATVADSATSATNATNATNDGSGQNIINTYATKAENATKLNAPAIEQHSIGTTGWTTLSEADPFTVSATVTATTTIGADATVELYNDQPVAFSQYCFSIASISGQTLTIYALEAPTSSVTLTIGITN